MTTQTTGRDPVAVAAQAAAQAEQEHRDAAALVDALRARVAAGDPNVTATEIATARSLAEFAELRAQAAARALDDAKEAHRQARLAAVRATLADLADDSDEIAALVRTAEQALTAVVEACQRRDPMLAEALATMHACGVPDRGAGWHGHPEHAGLAWCQWTSAVIADDRVISRIDPGKVLAALLRRVASQHALSVAPKLHQVAATDDPYALLAENGRRVP